MLRAGGSRGAIGSAGERTNCRARGRIRRAGALHDAVGVGRRGRRRDPDRQERRFRVRVLEARRDVRSGDGGCGPASLRRDRQARRAGPAGDGHGDRSRGPAGDHGRRGPRGRRSRRRARGRLRHGRHARPRRGRQRVLLRGRRRTAGRDHPDVFAGTRGHRRLRGAVQVSAGAERVRPAPRRGADRAWCARGLSDLVRDPAWHTRASLAGDIRRAGAGVRRARHRADHRPPGQRPRPGAQRRDPRRRRRAAVRPLSRRAQAPCPRGGPRQRHDRGRLCARGPGHARDALPGGVRGRRRCHGWCAEGRRVRGGRRAHRGADADRRSCGAASGRALISGAAPVTSSSAAAGSAASTSTSSRAPREPGASTRRPLPWSRRRSTSAPAAAPAGSVPEPAFRARAGGGPRSRRGSWGRGASGGRCPGRRRRCPSAGRRSRRRRARSWRRR